MKTKQRLSASVDAEVLAAAEAAVAAGTAENVSHWVNAALHRQMEHDKRMHALDLYIATYEAEHGVISEQEMLDASRWARAQATVVRGPKAAPGRARTAKRRRA